MLARLRHHEIGGRGLERAVKRRRVHELALHDGRRYVGEHELGLTTLALDAAENRYILTGAADATISIYDIEDQSGEVEALGRIPRGKKGHKFSVSSLEWYPADTGLFVSGGMDSQIYAFDTNSLKKVVAFRMLGAVYCVALSPVATTHGLIAGASHHEKLRLCDLRTGAFTHVLSGHRDSLFSVKWSQSDEYVLASACKDGSVRCWDIRRSGCLYALNHRGPPQTDRNSMALSVAHEGAVNALEFTQDGLYLVTSGLDRRMRLWDAISGENTLINFGAMTNAVGEKCCTLGSTRDGGFVAHPSGAHVSVYDTRKGQRVRTLYGHQDTVTACVFHPEWEDLYTASTDGELLLWTAVSSAGALGGVEDNEDDWSSEDEGE